MRDVGRLLGVEETLPTTTASADVAIGATSLPVADTAPFSEAGGTLTVHSTLGIQTYGYATPDDEALTLPLTTPTTVAIREGDDVSVPHAIERYAAVRLDDAPDVPVLARVPHSLVGRLPAGTYADDDLDALAIVETSPGDWVVEDVLGRDFARAGFADTDWTNSRGIKLIVGDAETDTAELLFGTHEMVAENRGPETTSFQLSSTGDWRRIGRTGAGSGPVSVTTDFPAKVTLSGVASVINTSAADWNVRFYLAAIDENTGEEFLGRQGTTYCPSADGESGHPNRHRQVTNERQFFFDASADNPVTINFWWGFQRDGGGSGTAKVRNMKMTLRVNYAPDIPTASDTPGVPTGETGDPDRTPEWTSFADTTEAYLRIESSDLDLTVEPP